MAREINAGFQDVITLAKTIGGEARGETYLGQVAVAWTIRARAMRATAWLALHTDKKAHPLFGNGSLASACLMPYQYSCWNDTDPNSALLRNMTATDVLGRLDFRRPIMVALQVISGDAADPTSGATHYYATSMEQPPNKPPRWANGLTPICTIGHHRFFNNVP